MASPANRRRAREAGIDLTTVAGSGPGRAHRARRSESRAGEPRQRRRTRRGARRVPREPRAETSEIKVIGVRRLIAERMSEAKRNIPHFAYVEEVDVTELEALRMHLNSQARRRASRA